MMGNKQAWVHVSVACIEFDVCEYATMCVCALNDIENDDDHQVYVLNTGIGIFIITAADDDDDDNNGESNVS